MVIANGTGSLANKPVEAVAYEAVCLGAVTQDHGFTVEEYGFAIAPKAGSPPSKAARACRPWMERNVSLLR